MKSSGSKLNFKAAYLHQTEYETIAQMGTFLNFVAVAYNSSTALPFGTVVVILLILTLG